MNYNIDFNDYDQVKNDDGTLTLKPKKVDKDWKPEMGAYYYYINTDEGMGVDWHIWDNDSVDAASTTFGNCYPSEELAEKAAKLMKRSNNIIRACLLVDPEFEPDWSDRNQVKYYVSRGGEEFEINRRWTSNTAPAYVSSEEKAKEVIKLLEKWGVE